MSAINHESVPFRVLLYSVIGFIAIPLTGGSPSDMARTSRVRYRQLFGPAATYNLRPAEGSRLEKS